MEAETIAKIKNEVAAIVKEDIGKDVKIIILEFTQKQDEKNEKKFASKQYENLIRKLIDGTTVALYLGAGGLVVKSILNFIQNNAIL